MRISTRMLTRCVVHPAVPPNRRRGARAASAGTRVAPTSGAGRVTRCRLQSTWTVPDLEDTVKVEVWDVCDTAKAGARTADRLALRHGESGPAARLDADSIDVFRGAHGVVYVFDPRKRWTFEYVQRQLPSVPARLPVLIFMNFSDVVTDELTVEGSGEGSPGRAKPVAMAEVEDLAQRESQRRAPDSMRLIRCSVRGKKNLKSVCSQYD